MVLLQILLFGMSELNPGGGTWWHPDQALLRLIQFCSGLGGSNCHMWYNKIFMKHREQPIFLENYSNVAESIQIIDLTLTKYFNITLIFKTEQLALDRENVYWKTFIAF